MHRFLLALLAVCLAAFAVGCGGDSMSISQQGGPARADGDSFAPSGDIADSKGTFSLYVLPENAEFNGDVTFSLETVETPTGSEVNVVADGNGLRTALLQLSYDPKLMNPIESKSTGVLANAGVDELSLVVADLPGLIHFGAVMPGLEDAAGLDGRQVVASFRFNNGEAYLTRQVRTAPKLPASAIPDLVIDPGTGDVSFSYYNAGDYDQNSEVNISDLTRVGIEFGESMLPGGFDPATAISVVDGDSNGEINASDITTIGQNFGNKVTGWDLYTGDMADYPTDAADDNGAATNAGNVAFDSKQGDPATDRLTYAVNIAAVMGSSDEAAWLRPLGSDGEGIASIAFDFSAAGDTTPPVWTNGEPGTGVLTVIAGDGQATVTWGEAMDSQSSPVTYVVYYNEGTEVDYETATTIEVVASEPADPFLDQLTTITGLTNDTEYAFAVRAKDAADPSNMEDNAVAITATPLAVQEMPSVITESMTFDAPMMVSSPNTTDVDCTEDVILTFNSSLTIEEGATLTGGGCDLCLIVKGNLKIDGTVDFDISGTPDLNGDVESLKIVPQGNFSTGENSIVSTDGNLYICDDEDDLISPEDAADDVDNGDFEEFDYTMMPLPDAESQGKGPSGASKTTSITQYFGPWWTWRPRGNWGKIPVPPANVNRIVLRITQRRGQTVAQNFSLEGPDGAPGTDDLGANCNATGGAGEDNKWRLRWHATRSITFDNVTLKFGDGGRGGDASTPGNCCPASATGGAGADSNNRFRITAGNFITINNAFNLNPGNGGRGGNAEATARDGIDDCPGEDGCDASAIGGVGGNVPRWGVRIRGAVFGAASLNLGQAEGGKGGDADAFAGDGGNGDPCCSAGSGGNADATGGLGGNAHFTDGGSAATGGGAKAGDGGAGFALAGNGGDGGDCYKAQAGNGGDGGGALATGGDPGSTTGDAPQVAGAEGAASAFGGDGGDGGDGYPVGAGGAEGIALAVGNPEIETDGLPGADGSEWPVGGQVIWCIPILDLAPDLPGAIPPGHSGMCSLTDMGSGEVVGEAPFLFFGPDATIFWGPAPPPFEGSNLLQFFNPIENDQNCGIAIDLRGLELTGPKGPIQGATLPIFSAQTLTPSSHPIGQFGFGDGEGSPFGLQEILPWPPGDPQDQTMMLDVPVPEAVFVAQCSPDSQFEIIDYIYIIDP